MNKNFKNIRTEKGIHSQELYKLIKKHWDENLPLVLYNSSIDSQALSEIELPGNLQFGLFTSGTSTGLPRLILYSKENILSSLDAVRSLFQTEKIDHIFCYPQPAHVFGFVLGYIQSIVYDIPISFSEGHYSKKAHDIWKYNLTKGTLTLGTPTHFIDLLNEVDNDKVLKSYSAIIGGASVSVKLWKSIQSKLNISSPSVGYGASEASPGICHLPPGLEPKCNGDVGYLLNGVTLDIQKSKEGFYFSGKNQCIGIIENKKLIQNESILIRDQLQLIDKNRYVMLGRTDSVINRGGIKYFPEMIEDSLTEVGIKAVAVPIYCERLGHDIAILVQHKVVDEDNEKNIDQIKIRINNIIIQRYNLSVRSDYICFENIEQNSNLKINRKESLKKILKSINLKLPLSVNYLIPFLPHRSSAIWVDEIIEVKSKYNHSRVLVNNKANYCSDGKIRQSALIEFIAQGYGYGFALNEILNNPKMSLVSNTMIAEVRDVIYHNQNVLEQINYDDKIYLDIFSECTHDFVKIKAIRGSVYYKDQKLIELNMKAVVF